MQVETFSSHLIKEAQNECNNWLKKRKGEIDVIDQQFRMSTAKAGDGAVKELFAFVIFYEPL